MQPKYKSVVIELAEDIRQGKLKPGDRLPTHRQIAHKYGLALGTATRVFAELEMMGMTVGEVGRGTFVRMNAEARAVEFALAAPNAQAVDFSRNRLVLPEQDEIFKATVDEILADNDCDVLDYRMNAGASFDRKAAATWLVEIGITQSDPFEDLTICAGGQHALLLSLMAACHPGQTVVVEKLTYPMVRLACETLHLNVVEVESDELGICPDAFERLCRNGAVRALFCMPNVQNPTSITLSAQRREAIARILKTYDVVAIEDDAYGFLLESPPPSLASLAPNHVFYSQTFSKSWAPGLRVCFLVSPPGFRSEIDKAQRATIWMSTPLLSSVMVRLIQSGRYSSVIRAKRKEIYKRQEVLTRILNELNVQTNSQSMHAILPLDSTIRVAAVLENLECEGVIVSPISQFAASGSTWQGSNGIRLCIGAPRHRADLEGAFLKIRDVVLGV